MSDDLTFAERYGPWAVIIGASDGVGAEYARAVAERGVGVVLVARRTAVLEEVAAHIADTTGSPTRTLTLDLADPAAPDTLAAATADLEVGLVVYCAGADPAYATFLGQPAQSAVDMVQRNCVAPIRVAHHYLGPMKARGRGGLVLFSSGAYMVGGRYMVAYSSSKAFDVVMAEALWAELHDHGVHVQGLVLGATDTPALRRLLLHRGRIARLDEPRPDLTTPEAVVARSLAELGGGPTVYATDEMAQGAMGLGGMPRNDAVAIMMQMGGGLMGDDDVPPPA